MSPRSQTRTACEGNLLGRDRLRGTVRPGDLGRLFDDQAGPLGLGLKDDARPQHRAGPEKNVGSMSGHQAIEDDAERVDVAGGCDRLAAHLLGAREFGSHGPRVGRVRVDCLEVEFGIEQLGNAEIEQLGLAFRGDKNVCRLQVAMDDQLLMSVFNRGADLKKELEPIAYGEIVPIAIFVNWQAGDVLHDKVRQAIFRCAAIEKMSDVRMIERCENLPFASEALQVRLGGAGCSDDLDCDVLEIVIVDPDGLEDTSHSALADFRHHLICADAPTFPWNLLLLSEA